MVEKAVDKKRVISELTKSSHGQLQAYVNVGMQAIHDDADFFAHLVAWNHTKGQIRDAKIALPVLALAGPHSDEQFENALAHLADLRPREFLRALEFGANLRRGPKGFEPKEPRKPILTSTASITTKTPKGKIRVAPRAKPAVASAPLSGPVAVPSRILRRLAHRYLRDLELDRKNFERVAVQHRKTLHTLYARYHVQRPDWVGSILFHGEKKQAKSYPGGVFDVIRRLHDMPPDEAAGMMEKYHIPFLIARGAIGKKVDTDTTLAFINAMSPSDLVTNMGALDKLGVKTVPALRAAVEKALGKAATSKTAKVTLKTSRAAQALEGDEVLSGKLHALQEKQLDKLGGIEGNWLILCDKSGSMQGAIAVARQVAGTLARTVKGNVHLVFFDMSPRYYDVTGMTLEAITKITAGVSAGGGTYMDCGIRYALDNKIHADGIVFVGDGANHGPAVVPMYRKYCEKMDIEPTVYFYQLSGEPDSFTSECKHSDLDVQVFDLRGQDVDYYSLPTLAQTMRVARFALTDEIYATPLRVLDDVLERTKGVYVLPRALTTA